MTGTQYLWIAITSLFLLMYVYFYYNGLKLVKVTTAACILTLGSPITTALAWTFQDAAVSWTKWVGMLIILCGVAVILWSAKQTTLVLKLLSARQHGRR